MVSTKYFVELLAKKIFSKKQTTQGESAQFATIWFAKGEKHFLTNLSTNLLNCSRIIWENTLKNALKTNLQLLYERAIPVKPMVLAKTLQQHKCLVWKKIVWWNSNVQVIKGRVKWSNLCFVIRIRRLDLSFCSHIFFSFFIHLSSFQSHFFFFHSSFMFSSLSLKKNECNSRSKGQRG